MKYHSFGEGIITKTPYHFMKTVKNIKVMNLLPAFLFTKKKLIETSYENITFKRLLQDINEFGTKLYEMGFKNKRIAVVGRNRYEWVVAHLSNLLGGMVSVPLDKELQVDELESCLARSKADVVLGGYSHSISYYVVE